MSDLLKSIICSLFRRVIARSSIEADIVALRHQVTVLRRQSCHRPKLTHWARLLFAVLHHPTQMRQMIGNQAENRVHTIKAMMVATPGH